jgi:tetratricopeptide (TPR) repeat protein
MTARQEGAPDDELHALDYMVYGYLQTAQDGAAKQVLDDLGRFAEQKTTRNAAPWSLAAIPARHAMERGAWAEAAELKTQRSNFAYTEAITHFARAVGLARSGKPEAAKADVEALETIVQSLRGKDEYWAEQVDIQRQAAEAWVAFASGQREAAVETMRQAAERESKTEKHPITPGPLAPAREQLAEMLLAVNRPAEALREFEAVQVTEPNRFRAVYGAGRAAEAAGDREAAKRHYARLTEIAARADTVRPELKVARDYLQKSSTAAAQ